MTRLLIGIGLTTFAAAAQPAAAPAFDVASIKASQESRSRNGFPGNNTQTTPDRLTMRGVTLKAAIAWAYHVFEYQVSGPDWTGADRYDIVAKSAKPATEPDLRAMLRTLLADRFQLALHHQSKEMQVYTLTVGKGGPKFQESKTEGDSDIVPDPKRLSVDVRRVPVAQLVDMLSRIFQTPVIDLTGLTARYDISINIAKYIPQNGENIDPLSIIQTGLQQELGLKLEPKKMAVDLWIVDRAEKAPVEN